jgi:hypothetical protein
VNSVDDLRRSFDRHAALTPEPDGIVALAHARVARAQHRRRVAAAVATAVAALLVAVGIPLAVHRGTMPAAPAPARTAAQMTIDLAGDAPFTVVQRATDGPRQLLVAANAGAVWAYDPGAFDPANLPHGRTVKIGGHDALLVPARTGQRVQAPPAGRPSGAVVATGTGNETVVWRAPSGIWITVTGALRRDTLLALAAAVRVTEPKAPAGPVGLTWLPPGVTVARTDTSESPAVLSQIKLSIANPRRNMVRSVPPGPGATSVEILIEPRTRGGWNTGVRLPAPTLRVAGFGGWYRHGTAGDGRLLIDTGSCGIDVRVADDSVVTSNELLKMMSLATYGSCTDETGWAPVVS